MKRVQKIIQQLLLAIEYCHRNQIMHRDVKPSNILYNPESEIVKLADFGIAKQGHLNPKCVTAKIGALFYRAPELLLESDNSSIGFPIDLWGVGCLMFECATGMIAFQGEFLN